MVLSLGTGLLFGWLVSLIYHVSKNQRMRLMMASFLGAWLGNYFWSSLGPAIYGFAPVPTLFGAAMMALMVKGLAQSVE